MKKALIIIAAIPTIAGCNTIAGMGKDIGAAGSAVDKAATDTEKKV